MVDLSDHEAHVWQQVGLCVWCIDCDTWLYEGELPANRRTIPKCPEGEHEWDDANSMSQCGFYYLCLKCGAKEWTE